MPNSWYVFPTRTLALQGASAIASLMSCPVVSRNCDTSVEDPSVQTTEGWAVPIHSQVGWIVPVPDDPSHRIQASVVDDPPLPTPSVPK